jgi:hypothetical protein
MILLPLLAAPAAAQEPEEAPPPRDDSGTPGFPARPQLPDGDAPPEGEAPDLIDELDLDELEEWIVLREDTAPPPPLLRAQAGVVVWFDIRSRIRADDEGVRGTPLEDLETFQGLESSGVSPWLELSIGGDLRGGADFLYLLRGGEVERQDDEILFDGVRLARPGDLIESRFELVTTSGFIEWDPLYGRTYRFGMVGGARYFRLQGSLHAVRPGASPVDLTVRRRGELISPFFGGFVELTPFEYLSVAARVQFMNWSWRSVGLKEARYLEFRLGGTVHLVPGRLGAGIEFRYFVIRAEAREEGGDPQRLEAGMAASGVAFTLTLSF